MKRFSKRSLLTLGVLACLLGFGGYSHLAGYQLTETPQSITEVAGYQLTESPQLTENPNT